MLDQPSKSVHADRTVRENFTKALGALSSGDPDSARNLLETNVSAGCSESMVLLGNIFGNETEDERRRSIDLYAKAAELGNSSGYRNLAYCYAVGINIPKDKEKAVELYTKASELGNARAACNLGVMYDYGNGTEQDFCKAFHWYTVSAEGGCTRGMTNLGEYYLWGKGTEIDYSMAEQWLLKSSSPRALYRLAELYLDIEQFKDPEKGMKYLMDSSDRGYSRAMARYAGLLESNDLDRSLELYNKAAEKGNRDAIQYLESHGLPVPESLFSKRKKNTNQ